MDARSVPTLPPEYSPCGCGSFERGPGSLSPGWSSLRRGTHFTEHYVARVLEELEGRVFFATRPSKDLGIDGLGYSAATDSFSVLQVKTGVGRAGDEAIASTVGAAQRFRRATRHRVERIIFFSRSGFSGPARTAVHSRAFDFPIQLLSQRDLFFLPLVGRCRGKDGTE